MHGQETSLLAALMISCSIVFLIMGYFIVTIIRHQRLNRRLYQEKLQVEINTLEKERKRIASDLHDELGPLLSSIKLQIGCINTLDEEDNEIVNKSAEHIDSALLRLKAIANDLMPTVLLRKGIVEATREFVNAINRSESKLKIQFVNNDFEIKVRESEVHIYRIMQEIIHNCLRHSQATRLCINFEGTGHLLSIEAVDDGKGFDSEVVLVKGLGLGLSNIVSRVEMLRGYLDIQSKPGKGTKIRIEIPQ